MGRDRFAWPNFEWLGTAHTEVWGLGIAFYGAMIISSCFHDVKGLGLTMDFMHSVMRLAQEADSSLEGCLYLHSRRRLFYFPGCST